MLKLKTLDAFDKIQEEEIRLFVFAEGREKRTEDQLQQDMENIVRQLKSNVTKVLIGREVLGEEDQKWKFKVLVEHKTGNDTPEIRGFKTIGCKVGENLESRVADLATGNFEDSRGGIKEIIKEAKGLYSDLKEKNLIQNSDKEAAQHGFISGMLMNFRYRYNLRLYLELLTGRGYSDIVLLVRGKSRSWTAIPIVMELKVNDNVENALTEASSYARGLRRNKMRLLTNSEYAICMGVNLNEQEDSYIISNKPSQIKRNEEPFVQSLLDIVYSDEKCKDKESQVKNLLGQLYYTFPSEQYTRYYLSRFLLGQLSLLKKPKKAESMSVYLFNHSGKDIKGRDIEGHLTTYIVVVKGQDNRNRVLIFHIQEGGTDRFQYNKYSFYKEVLSKIGLTEVKCQDLIEVYINGYKETGPSQSALSPGLFYEGQNLVKIENKDPTEYFEGFHNEIQRTRSSTLQNKFKGSVESVNLIPKLANKFKEAIDYQYTWLGEEIKQKKGQLGNDNKFGLGAYKNLFDTIKELMCDKDGIPKQGFVSMIGSESMFKAFLDGLFTGLSDLDRDRVIAVLTEFQVGEGKRVDMMMQIIDNKNPDENKKAGELKESISMGFELKFSEKKGGDDEKLGEADRQIAAGYAERRNIKSITEGKNVAFIGVSFNKNAGSKDKLILLSENIILAGVPHSSTDVSLRSQLSELSLQNPQLSTFTEQLRNTLL
ncbi:hypothetical protein [Wolbachia endosymbiont (group A) of Sphaerophoria taeniata]|uniref:hypothetical protein n=1 Tax=Wolbachia endosymbiont (group A) of Sphaerophoria taeniata TaxID=2954057 RepID=UPI0022273FD9|nr:hypothetical protein [Wolbachia endosymbiont (group A) of Sphaerophoria taeniata]